MNSVPLRSPLLTWVVVMFLALIQAAADAVTSTEVWLGWAPTTLSSWGTSAFLGSVIASCAAAWICGQPHLHSFARWRAVSPRSWAADAVPAAVLVSSAVVFGQLVVLLGMFAASMRRVGPGGEVAALWLEIPTVCVYVTAWACFGALTGRLLPSYVALGTSVVMPYAFYAGVTSYVSGSPFVHLLVGEGLRWVYVRPSADNLFLRFLVWTLLCAALFSAMYSWKRSRGWVFATGFALSIALFGGARTVPIPESHEAVCSGEQPVVCVDTAHSGVLIDYRKAVDQMWPLIPQSLRPEVVVQDEEVAKQVGGTRRESILVVGPVAGDTEPSHVLDRARFTQVFGTSVLRLRCVPRSAESGGVSPPVEPRPPHLSKTPDVDARLVLLAWWRLESGLPLDGSGNYWDVRLDQFENYEGIVAAARGLVDLSAAEQRKWFTTVSDDIHRCAHDDIVFP